MKLKRNARRKALLVAALGALAYQAPAHAGLCTVSDSGTPILTTVNPKPFTVPPPATCLVNGLPGVGSDLPGYILKQTRTADIIVSGVKVGNLYDRAYCLGSASTCDATNTWIIATRVQMLATPVNFPARNPNCPLWSGTSNECFEINDIFRNILGTNSVPISAAVGYWMGASGSTADTAPAVKYLEYTGKTYKGLNETITRDNTKIAYRTDVNVSDPDGVDAPWSPWLLVRQTCAGGVSGTPAAFAIKYWQGGEEGQIQTNVQASAYKCT